MRLLYITADRPQDQTGGGVVTRNELQALCKLAPCEEWSKNHFIQRMIQGTFVAKDDTQEPWYFDAIAAFDLTYHKEAAYPQLTHIYAGTWDKTVKILKDNGCRTSVTIAAHNVDVSKREHEKLGFGFNLPHLTDPELWKRYIEGYRLADIIIVPGSVPEATVRDYGPEFENKDIRIVPHGCTPPKEVKPLPSRFIVGYLGSFGADKGVVYLLKAWKKLAYKDAVLILAGRDSTSPLGLYLIEKYGGGNIILKGWVNDVSEFYNSISLFCCSAATEGFNLEVLETMASGRAVLCSVGAGAVDLVPMDARVDACDENDLAEKIDEAKKNWNLEERGKKARRMAECYTWDIIQQKYLDIWKEMIS